MQSSLPVLAIFFFEPQELLRTCVPSCALRRVSFVAAMDSPDLMAPRRTEAYNAMKVHFEASDLFAFTAWCLNTTRLTSYDERARNLLDTQQMATVSTWGDYFVTDNVKHEDTKQAGM